MTGAASGQVLVVGLGSVDRGDDGIGPAVADRVAAELAAGEHPGVDVVAHEDPTALVELMAGRDVMVVIDAVRTGSPAGTVTVLDVGRDRPGALDPVRPGPAGTHGLGLASAIELARALDRLPARVTVVGVEAGRFDHGAPLSGAVAAAIPGAVSAVLTYVLDHLGPSRRESDDVVRTHPVDPWTASSAHR